MTPIDESATHVSNSPERELLPLSLLNDYVYCPRRAALKAIEGWRDANEHTVQGDIVHEHTNLPGYQSEISNLKSETILWRALPVWSERLGLSGKCDAVEAEFHSRGDLQSDISNLKSLQPVEFKLGKCRQWENDDVQLCAQALCLEEMFGIQIRYGAIYHAKSRRRRTVEFTPELRAQTEDAIANLHALLRDSEISNLRSEIPRLPPAILRPACEECSLFSICLPDLTSQPELIVHASQQLFKISNLKSESSNLKSQISNLKSQI